VRLNVSTALLSVCRKWWTKPFFIFRHKIFRDVKRNL